MEGIHLSDKLIARRIRDFEKAVEIWATKNDLWLDCGFQSWADRVDGEPGDPPVATIAYFEGEFGRMLDEDYPELYREFESIEKKHGFWHERWDGVSAHFYVEEDSPLAKPIVDYMRWQWICGLVKPDFADVYDEVYGHFARRVDDVHKLHWRKFEILISEVLRSQGFEVELGPGWGDEGVDMRLLQRDPLGDILTMVQVKKSAPHKKIGLQAVQALHGAASALKAQKSLFVTSSSYLPGVKKWAERYRVPIEFAASGDVLQWCQEAYNGVIEDKSRLVDPVNVAKLIAEVRGKTDSRIVHSIGGIGMTTNAFALVLKETRNAALLMGLPAVNVTDDGYGQIGTEVPLLDPANPPPLTRETVWRAKRQSGNGNVGYWDGNRLYGRWDGQPKYFNYMD
ncbi:MAG TPA: restriction endonuclease [Marinobacter hydrocarbonoclasticus]|nr:restriction endonuclease [Alcanivorax sp.]MBI53616.1 restriction endonuclease [Alcanivorax sp.]HAX10644.1 restriction endonuclease [Marinobacter nauticus]|tara:strand:- start:1491 stop:2681 length:1191 start_codon:yes stop_codon:yes gene_type:complete